MRLSSLLDDRVLHHLLPNNPEVLAAPVGSNATLRVVGMRFSSEGAIVIEYETAEAKDRVVEAEMSDDLGASTAAMEFVVRIQSHVWHDPEILCQFLASIIKDRMSSYDDAHHVSVHPLDLETATGRQAYDHHSHEMGTASTCWCGQPHDHGLRESR